MSDVLSQAVRSQAQPSGRLPCVDALALARRLQVLPEDVRAAADDAGIKITQCQLGLFGPRRLSVREGDQDRGLPLELLERLRGLPVAELACATACALADDLAVAPLSVGQAATALGIRLYQCQLGCF